MNRAEVSEIKKLFQIRNCSITRICGCYVDGEKEIKAQWQQPFLAMPEEEMFKYLDIFRKCLSGTVGKTLTEVTPATAKAAALWELRDSKLKEQDRMEEFYQNIIDTYEHVGNYLILVIHDVYDIPGKTSDGATMDDASDEVYEYILACICPVNLSKPGLGYNSCERCFTNLTRDWVVSTPEMAILYPAFNDRSQNLEKALYYTRSMDEKQQSFIEQFLGYTIPITPKNEADVFNTIVEEVLGYDKSFTDVREVMEAAEAMAERCLDTEGKKITVEDIRKILEESGIKQDRISQLDNIFNEVAGVGAELNPVNIINRREFSIKTPSMQVKLRPEDKYKASVKVKDGVRCLVLELGTADIEVNGVVVKAREME